MGTSKHRSGSKQATLSRIARPQTRFGVLKVTAMSQMCPTLREAGVAWNVVVKRIPCSTVLCPRATGSMLWDRSCNMLMVTQVPQVVNWSSKWNCGSRQSDEYELPDHRSLGLPSDASINQL